MKNNNINEIIITDENEKEYLAEFQKIKKALINRYAPLVKYEAFKIKETININFENYAKNKLGFEDEDFESLGFLGLLDAIDRYNPNNESDIKFETYASMSIQGAILDGLRVVDGLPKLVRREIRKSQEKLVMVENKMINNLTKKEIDNLCEWAKKYNIEDLDTEEKILSIILDKELKIVSDEIDYLPNEIFKLTNLESFYIDCYSLAEFPKDIEKLITEKQPFGLIMYDLDDFKHINDYYGHNEGDSVLHEIAARSQKCCDSYCTGYRLGGDEFMVLVRSGDLQTIEKYARKFHKIFSDPFQVASESLMLHCSMGAAMYPHDGDSVFTLLEAADSAMYMVKKSGKDNIVFSWDIC